MREIRDVLRGLTDFNGVCYCIFVGENKYDIIISLIKYVLKLFEINLIALQKY